MYFDPEETRECEVCGEQMKWIKHLEPADDSYQDESYWECGNGCLYPSNADCELSSEELIERYADWTLSEITERGLKISFIKKDEDGK